ncbi:MAG: hydrogenase formation protein HypD [Deltaproteobacteria bacterium]|nr:hydrogenase formation protein HypD [Deltaproteobacteria bacterium]
MKHVDEYRDPALARELAQRLREESSRPVRFMELCGTHTMAIARHGITGLLPPTVELISGPGCPVCVTSGGEIDRMVELARRPEVVVATFGDMVRVPGTVGSLALERARGAAVEVVYSPLDAVDLAAGRPDRQVVFLGIGFETTAPTVAAAGLTARQRGLANFSFLSAHKLLPPALAALLTGPELGIDGFLCPGHVTTVIGSQVYEPAARDFGKACVVSGFEPVDILASLLMLVRQVEAGRPRVEIQYGRAVHPQGNPAAVALMNQLFRPADAPWRGLGVIPASGLVLAEEFADLDAARRFDLPLVEKGEPAGCRCGEVLRGLIRPPECRLFAKVCDPGQPVGPCMVSSEGTCAAWYKYRREE